MPSDKVTASAGFVGLPRVALAAACNAALGMPQHTTLRISGGAASALEVRNSSFLLLSTA